MITKITDETTVKEICEVLDFIGGKEKDRCMYLKIFSNMNGRFKLSDDCTVCGIDQLSDYIADHTQKTELDKFLSLSDDEFSEYVYKILEDPGKSEILFDAIKEVLR